MRIKDGINPVDRVNTVAAESESSSEENEVADEIQQTREIQKFKEFGRDTLKDSVSRRKKSSYKSAQKRVLTTMMAVSAVVVLTVSPISIFEPIFGPVLDPVFGPVLDPEYGDSEDTGYEGGVTGGFSEVVASEDTIWYTVSLDGLRGDETITVDLTNRFTDRSSSVEGDGDSGSQTGLKPGMTYTLTLRDGSHVLSSVTVETQREVETFFHFEGGGCTCLIDGMFHFSAEIIDGGVQHGFTATLADWYGNVSITAIDPEVGEYSLPVTGADLLGDTAVLRITCVQDLEDGGTEIVVLYESEFTI